MDGGGKNFRRRQPRDNRDFGRRDLRGQSRGQQNFERRDSWQDGQQQPGKKPGDWTCAECGAGPCFASRTECFRCGAPRPGGASRFDSELPEFKTDFANTRVFVENLPPHTGWPQLKDHFAAEGYPVVYASVSTDRATGRSKGHGIVQFETVHAAEHAIKEMTGHDLDGYDINVRPDYQERSRRAANGGGYGGGGGSDGGYGRAQQASKAPWMAREWTRVTGTADDDDYGVDEARIAQLLRERDDCRSARDYESADRLLGELTDLGVSLDDAVRQKVWWLGRRADGKGGEKRSRGAAENRNRREWYGGGPRDRDADGGRNDGW